MGGKSKTTKRQTRAAQALEREGVDSTVPDATKTQETAAQAQQQQDKQTDAAKRAAQDLVVHAEVHAEDADDEFMSPQEERELRLTSRRLGDIMSKKMEQLFAEQNRSMADKAGDRSPIRGNRTLGLTPVGIPKTSATFRGGQNGGPKARSVIEMTEQEEAIEYSDRRARERQAENDRRAAERRIAASANTMEATKPNGAAKESRVNFEGEKERQLSARDFEDSDDISTPGDGVERGRPRDTALPRNRYDDELCAREHRAYVEEEKGPLLLDDNQVRGQGARTNRGYEAAAKREVSSARPRREYSPEGNGRSVTPTRSTTGQSWTGGQRKEVKLDHYAGTSDIQTYLAHFRLAATHNRWDKEEWAEQLALKLRGEA